MDFEKTINERMELQPLIEWLGDPEQQDQFVDHLYTPKSAVVC